MRMLVRVLAFMLGAAPTVSPGADVGPVVGSITMELDNRTTSGVESSAHSRRARSGPCCGIDQAPADRDLPR
jgi:hypothetical protein